MGIDVLQVRPSDSPGYVRLVLSDPIGVPAAGAEVVAALPGGGEQRIIVHGQRELELLADATLVTFPDGSTFKPSTK